MVGWHHRLSGHEFEQTPGVGDGQGSLVCYSPWGRKESDTTERLNNNKSRTRDSLYSCSGESNPNTEEGNTVVNIRAPTPTTRLQQLKVAEDYCISI